MFRCLCIYYIKYKFHFDFLCLPVQWHKTVHNRWQHGFLKLQKRETHEYQTNNNENIRHSHTYKTFCRLWKPATMYTTELKGRCKNDWIGLLCTKRDEKALNVNVRERGKFTIHNFKMRDVKWNRQNAHNTITEKRWRRSKRKSSERLAVDFHQPLL